MSQRKVKLRIAATVVEEAPTAAPTAADATISTPPLQAKTTSTEEHGNGGNGNGNPSKHGDLNWLNNQSECTICTERFTGHLRKPICCEYCEFVACRQCVRQYLFSVPEPVCANTSCKRVWTRRFLSNHFGITFVTTEYRKHHTNELWKTQQALMPSTMHLVVKSNKIDSHQREKQNLLQQVARLQDQIVSHDRSIARLRERIRMNDENCDSDHDNQLPNVMQVKTKSKTQHFFQTKCMFDNCKGFLDNLYHCALCKNHFCKECMDVLPTADPTNAPTLPDAPIPPTEISETGSENSSLLPTNSRKRKMMEALHVCNPERLATYQMMKKDTKPCPRCGMGITKLEGCMQMWCTACNTGFLWTTGELLDNRRIHNPHFFEWQQTHGNAPVATLRQPQCCDPRTRLRSDRVHPIYRMLRMVVLRISTQTALFQRRFSKTPDDVIPYVNYGLQFLYWASYIHFLLNQAVRCAMHMYDANDPRRAADLNFESVSRNLRLSFLLGTMKEAECAKEMQSAENSMLRIRERVLLAEMFHETVATIIDNFETALQQFFAVVKAISEQNEAIDVDPSQWKWFPAFDLSVLLELERLRVYYNREACCISRTYASTETYIQFSYQSFPHKF